MNQADFIITCRWLIPVVPRGVVLENHALAIQDGKIAAIFPQSELKSYQDTKTITLNQHALLPGLINMHTHSPMTLFRGLADDLPLMEWLNNHIWPAERKWLSDEFITDGTHIAVAEMIRSGTTTFNEHFFYPEAIAKVILKHQVRACLGPTIIKFPINWSEHEEDAFNKFLQARETVTANPLLIWSLAPHSPYGTSDAILIKIRDYAEQHKLPIHMHLHETAQEVTDSLAEFGKRPIQRLYDLGLLSSRFQGVHMTQVNDEDLAIIKKTGMQVTHCPESNLKLVSGYCPVATLLQENVNVSLGTDGAASNNDVDMMGEMRTAALIGKTIAGTATAVSAQTTLEMATINGAKALGLENVIGSLEVGKAADIIAIDLEQINTMPVYHPISQIVYAASSRQVTDSWVAGNQLLSEGKLTHFDEAKLKSTAWKWFERLNSLQ